MVAMVEAALADGVDAAFDRYPYVAYSTGLTNLFPVWSRDGGTDAFLARLRDPAVATRLREAVLAKVALIGGWDNVQVSGVRAVEDRATFEQPFQYPVGIPLVVVNGAVGLRDGQRGAVGSGRGVRATA